MIEVSPRSEPFEEHSDRYDRWFEKNEYAYESELNALDALVPKDPDGVSVGVGTGRFAAPLGIETGIDPSAEMLGHARHRGIESVKGIAEALPFKDGSFDTALSVTTVCFVDDLGASFREARRVLREDGCLVVGYVDRESPLGRRYEEYKEQNPFYKEATFVSTEEIDDELREAGFGEREYVQTVFSMPEEMDEPESYKKGYGDGSFVGVRASPDT